MDDREKLLESLGIDVSDGKEPDWSALEASLGGESDRELIGNLKSLSLMASFYRALREEDRAQGIEIGEPGSGTEPSVDDTDQDAGSGNQMPAGGTTSSRRWGHLEILNRIGRGSYGDVYRARDTQLNREVALKVIHGAGASSERSSFLKEAKHLACVKHPNLVTIHGAEVRGSDLGLWMEYIQGHTLHDLIAKQGPLSGREAVLLGIDLCGALAALHSVGLVHRDIKAHNVMRESGGRVVLMDLGSGAEIVPAAHQQSEAVTVGVDAREGGASAFGGETSGTPLYMAPEVMAGGKATIRSDIYSLGVLLYYAVTGSYPVTGKTYNELKQCHALGKHIHLRNVRPDLPAPIVSVVERAVAQDAEKRYASVGEVEQALSAALGVADSVAEPMPVSPKVVSRGSHKDRMPWTARYLPAFLVSAAVVFLVTLVLFVWPGVLIVPSYTVSAALCRLNDGVREELLSGSRVALGDRLFLDFEASRTMYVYVLAEDEQGEAYLLFPIAGQATTNPLGGKQPHRLPPDEGGRQYTWGVSSAGGTEHILVVASPDRLADFEQALVALPAPSNPETVLAMRLNQEALRRLRGIGHLIESEPAGDPPATHSAFALARRLSGGPEQNQGIWVRQIDLINPRH